MSRRVVVVGLVVFVVALFGLFFMIALVSMVSGADRSSGGPKIGVVELSGTLGEEIEGAREAEQVRDMARNADVKAIVVRIDSPGGAPAPSQELHEEILRARQSKPVVCSLGQVAASGGYYVAVGCQQIIANRATLTGSIGVISQFMAAPSWLETAKVEQTTLKTGALKDAGSPLRSFTPEDRAYYESLMQDIYGQFLKAVADGRGMTEEQVRPLADGRVFTGQEAKTLGLIDGLGNFRSAVDAAMALAQVEGEPELVYPEEPNTFPLAWLWNLAPRGDARSTARAVTRGAIDGLTGRNPVRGGVMMLAPGFAP